MIISALLFFLSTLSKETSLVLPLLIVSFDIIFRDAGKRLRLPIRYIPYAIALAVYFALRINALSGLTPKQGVHPYLNGFQYFINIFPLFVDHIKTLVFPMKLSIFHVFHPVYSIGELRAIVSIVITIIIFAIFCKLKKRERLYLFSFILMILPLLPALYIPALDRNPFAERYQYLSGAGFSLFIALLFRETYDYHCKKQGERIIIYIAIPFVILIAVYAIGTIKRNFEWKDRFTLWNASVEDDPENYMALREVGGYFMGVGNDEKGIAFFERSIEANKSRRDPDQLILGLTYLNLADTYREAKRPEEAIENYSIVLQMDPMRFRANLNIAILYHELERLDLALLHYKKAGARAREVEDIAGILMNIGNIHAKKRQWKLALNSYSEALKIMPGNPTLLKNIELIRKQSK